MKISIETQLLLENGLTFDEFVILYCLHNKEYQLIFDVLNCSESTNLLNDLIKGLELKGFVKNVKGLVTQIGDLTLVYLKIKGLELFKSDESAFLKFWNLYPIKVGIGNNLRVLRAKDIDSAQGKNCKIKFEKITKHNPTLEQIILKGLEVELQIRKKTNTMQFFQLIDTYLNQKTWEKYSDFDLEEDNNERFEGI